MIKPFPETVLCFQLNYGIFSCSWLFDIDLEPVRADSSKGLGSPENARTVRKEGSAGSGSASGCSGETLRL